MGILVPGNYCLHAMGRHQTQPIFIISYRLDCCKTGVYIIHGGSRLNHKAKSEETFILNLKLINQDISELSYLKIQHLISWRAVRGWSMTSKSSKKSKKFFLLHLIVCQKTILGIDVMLFL